MAKKSLIFFFSFLLLISFASAGLLEEANFNETDGEYGSYNIDSYLPNWLGGGGKAEIKLIDNTDQCLINCKATLEGYFYENRALLDEIEFLDRKGNLVTNIKDLKFRIGQWETVEYEVPVYEEVCEEVINNSNTTTVCSNNLISVDIESKEEFVWKGYEGEEIAGYYKLEITAKKNPKQKMDWVITVFGEELTEWAWWDSSWEFKRLINLTSSVGNFSYIQTIPYNSSMQTDFEDLRFIDFATESIELNYTIENFTDSNYATIRVYSKGDTAVYMYYGNNLAGSNSNAIETYFNPSSGYYLDSGANDITGTYNGTINAATITSGYINRSYSFNGADQDISLGSQPKNSVFTIAAWIRPDAVNGNIFARDTNPNRGFVFRLNGGYLSLEVGGTGPPPQETTGVTVDGTTWTHVAVSFDENSNVIKFYVNGDETGDGLTSTATQTTSSVVTRIGSRDYSTSRQWFNGSIDEVLFFDSELPESRVYELYTQTSPTYSIGAEEQNAGVNTELIAPIDSLESVDTQINFSVNSSSVAFTLIDNVTLYIWNATDNALLVSNFTALDSNTSVVTNWTNTFGEGDYIWNAETCGDAPCDFATNRTFTIHFTAPTVEITAPTGLFNRSANTEETLIYNISEAGQNLTEHLVDCWFEYNNTEVLNNISYSTSSYLGEWEYETKYTNVSQVTDGTTTLTNIPESCSNRVNFTLAVTTDGFFNFAWLCLNEIDVFETISIEPLQHQATPNITATQRRHLNCTDSEINFTYVDGLNEISVFAEDSFGLIGNDTTTWSYLVELFNLTYEESVYEGQLSTFDAEVIIGAGATLTQAIFSYNETNYTTNIVFAGGEYLISSTLSSPTVSADTNFSLGFYLVINGNTYFFNSRTQEVLNAVFGGCVAGDVLVNLSLADEETRSDLLGDIEITAELLSKTTNEIVETLNATFTNSTYGAICLTPIESKENYVLDVKIRYSSTDYASEFYNIQRADLTDYPKNLTVFSLSLNDSTEFLVKYQDDSLIPVENAIIQLIREYTGLGISEVVEAPTTSDIGTAIVHVDLNTNSYSAIVIKDGEVLDIFENLVFHCENELSGQCTENLLGRIDPQNIIALETLNDFTYSISESNEVITTTFSVPSGTPKSINVYLKQVDTFGEESICNQTIVSSGGSLDCSYNATIGDSVIELFIKKDDVLQASKSYIVYESGGIDWLGNNYWIVLILSLSLVGMAMTSPEWIVINVVITVLLSGGLWLLNGMNFVMGLGSLIWLFISAGILILKISKQEDR